MSDIFLLAAMAVCLYPSVAHKKCHLVGKKKPHFSQNITWDASSELSKTFKADRNIRN